MATTTEIQRALLARSFDPGPIDGAPGPRTKAAITAFQTANGLVVDGIAGLSTLRALGLAVDGTGGITLSREALDRLFPGAHPGVREMIFRSQIDVLPRFEINKTRRRLAYFLAQSAEESGGYTTFGENLRYSAKRMVEVWPGRFRTIAAAQPYANNPEALANRVYGSRMGNGDEASGDGWLYRGRGPIQLTGKANYLAVGEFIHLDLVNNPDWAADREHMMLVNAGYWALHDLNRFADEGDFKGLTKAINGGFTNLELRKEWLSKVEREMGR